MTPKSNGSVERLSSALRVQSKVEEARSEEREEVEIEQRASPYTCGDNEMSAGSGRDDDDTLEEACAAARDDEPEDACAAARGNDDESGSDWRACTACAST